MGLIPLSILTDRVSPDLVQKIVEICNIVC